jgi:hypothetical protein
MKITPDHQKNHQTFFGGFGDSMWIPTRIKRGTGENQYQIG